MTRYVVRPMQFEDIDAVSEVERECFTTPWPTSAYRRELRDNRMGRYIVLTESLEEEQLNTGEQPVRHEEPANRGMRHAVGQLLRPFGRANSASASPKKERIGGFAGMWLMLDEAHVTTIGVRPDLRGQGWGELLLATLLEIAMGLGAHRATLEVRVSNHSAQALYRKYTFREEGIRKRYYSDNNEDALIMWSERLEGPQFRARYFDMRAALNERLDGLVDIQI